MSYSTGVRNEGNKASDSMAKEIGFIGLGVMGFPIAGHLARAGYDIKIYNRSAEKLIHWQSVYQNYSNAQVCTQLLELRSAHIITTCVSDGPDVQEIHEALLPLIQPHTLFIDHSTTSAEVAQQLYANCQKYQAHFIDAPLSGGQSGAEKGALTIMCGGEAETFTTAQQILNHYAKKTALLGGPGCGQLTKMVNQICIGGLLQGLAEGIHFAQQAGLDVTKVIDVIRQGAAQSWQMENRYQTMIANQYTHGFAVNLMRKDFNICLNEARKLGVQLPVTALVDQFYAEIQAKKGGHLDTSSLLTRLIQTNA